MQQLELCNEDVDELSLLVEAGVPVDQANNNGETPLSRALDTEVKKLLFRHATPYQLKSKEFAKIPSQSFVEYFEDSA